MSAHDPPGEGSAESRERQAADAARHARIALEGRRPLELDTTVALLRILSSSLDQEIALEAAAALVALRRELVQRRPDSSTALRDLPISLDNVGNIQAQRGQLEQALTAYTESLDLAQRIRTSYGETPQVLRDISSYQGNIELARRHMVRSTMRDVPRTVRRDR